LSEEFDVKEHANKIIQSLAITQQLGKLAEGISLLDKEIHSQVQRLSKQTILLSGTIYATGHRRRVLCH
jgi:hypothetical protein